MWHLQEVEGLLRRIDELDAQQLGAALTAYEVAAPETKNAISAPFNFNLMFRTSIGPKGDLTGFLRPETAQGIFVNFKCALEHPTVLQLTFERCHAVAVKEASYSCEEVWQHKQLPHWR